MDPASEAGRTQIRGYLEQRAAVVGSAERTSRLLGPGADLVDTLTIFRDRGLSADTSIAIDLAIEQALDVMKTGGAIREGSVRRVALVGPGLDFVDKQNGYDFYPQQTIQPFALIDSLVRLGLAEPTDLQVTAFDLSPRVLGHLEGARARAGGGTSYTVVLPRNVDQPWAPDLVDYWQRFGNWIGNPEFAVPRPPSGERRVEVRGISVRPSVVLSVTPVDLNIVTERLDRQFDLVIATNVLLYYDVFEQSLAAANIARMLRPGGFLLTNNRIFELPNSPLAGVGFTDVAYMSLPGIGDAGDRVIWYQRQ
jgi:SAM-dependent methyltransferase